jgi:NADPH:quinone reductase-like Zn-dependent oxidoreductase
MKAIVYTAYGPPEVLRVKEIALPVPKENEMLIKIRAAAVTAADSAFRKGSPRFARLFTGIFGPRKTVLGTELSGEVVAVGKNVIRFKKGDQVFGCTGNGCGGHAEYIALPEMAALAQKPENLSFAEAAGLCEALTALPFLRDKGAIGRGQKVLINGASGAVGSYAVQLAKHFGAEVTAVCSAANKKLAQELGAAAVIDYATADFTKSTERYDIIFDAVGKSSFRKCKAILAPEGIYLSTVPSVGLLFRALFTSGSKGRKAGFQATGLRPHADRAKDLLFLKALSENGQVRPVIDHTFPLEKAADAHRYVDTGRKKGSVVLTIG